MTRKRKSSTPLLAWMFIAGTACGWFGQRAADPKVIHDSVTLEEPLYVVVTSSTNGTMFAQGMTHGADTSRFKPGAYVIQTEDGVWKEVPAEDVTFQKLPHGALNRDVSYPKETQ